MRYPVITTAHNSLSQRRRPSSSPPPRTRGSRCRSAPHLMACSARTALAARPDHRADIKSAIPEQISPPTVLDRPPGHHRRPRACLPGLGHHARRARWGVTVFQAEAEIDTVRSGPLDVRDALRPPATKSSLYDPGHRGRGQSCAACGGSRCGWKSTPVPLDYSRPEVHGPRPSMRQSERTIDWTSHTTEEIVRRVRAADSGPGCVDHPAGWAPVYAFGAHEEDVLRVRPAQILVQRHGALSSGPSTAQ